MCVWDLESDRREQSRLSPSHLPTIPRGCFLVGFPFPAKQWGLEQGCPLSRCGGETGAGVLSQSSRSPGCCLLSSTLLWKALRAPKCRLSDTPDSSLPRVHTTLTRACHLGRMQGTETRGSLREGLGASVLLIGRARWVLLTCCWALAVPPEVPGVEWPRGVVCMLARTRTCNARAACAQRITAGGVPRRLPRCLCVVKNSVSLSRVPLKLPGCRADGLHLPQRVTLFIT